MYTEAAHTKLATYSTHILFFQGPNGDKLLKKKKIRSSKGEKEGEKRHRRLHMRLKKKKRRRKRKTKTVKATEKKNLIHTEVTVMRE